MVHRPSSLQHPLDHPRGEPLKDGHDLRVLIKQQQVELQQQNIVPRPQPPKGTHAAPLPQPQGDLGAPHDKEGMPPGRIDWVQHAVKQGLEREGGGAGEGVIGGVLGGKDISDPVVAAAGLSEAERDELIAEANAEYVGMKDKIRGQIQQTLREMDKMADNQPPGGDDDDTFGDTEVSFVLTPTD